MVFGYEAWHILKTLKVIALGLFREEYKEHYDLKKVSLENVVVMSVCPEQKYRIGFSFLSYLSWPESGESTALMEFFISKKYFDLISQNRITFKSFQNFSNGKIEILGFQFIFREPVVYNKLSNDIKLYLEMSY